jgi:hypothetical protein
MMTSSEPAVNWTPRRGPPPWATGPSFLHLALPLSVAVAFTLMRSGFAALLPLPVGLLVWIALVLPSWWGAQLATAAAHRLFRPWTPPLWFLCLIGSIVQALALSPWLRSIYAWAEHLAGTGLHGEWPLPELSVRYALALATAIAPGALLWASVNYLYDRVLGVPRFRYAADAATPEAGPTGAPIAPTSVDDAARRVTPDPSPVPSSTASFDGADASNASAASRDAATVRATPASAATLPPAGVAALLARSRLPADAEIRAVTAEEHYVCLYTDQGRDLVRYRFADALYDLAPIAHGIQVHRSWWVRLDRVADVIHRDRTFDLVLDDGLRVPVSLAFRSAVRQRLRERRAP